MKLKKIMAFLISVFIAMQCTTIPVVAESSEEITNEVEPVEIETSVEPSENKELVVDEIVIDSTSYLASAITSGDFTYTVNDDGETATITGFVGEESGDLIIPSEIDGYTVTSIGDYAFYNCSGFTGTLMIPDSVTSIGSYAFEDCDGFTGSLVLPDSLSFIGESSFFSCSGFTGSLTIPDSVTTIGKYAFSHCSGFTGDLTIPDSVTSISKGTFSYCSGFVGDLMIPDSVTTIGDYAFSSCSGFTGFLTIPDSVTTIGDYAFSECTGLTGTLTIPDSVTTLGEGAFLFCENFTGTLIISDSVTSIEYATFVGCSGFTGTLTIPESVTTIGDCAFRDCAGFTGSLIIPDGVTTIGDYSFEGCTGFTGTLTMPDSVTSIGVYAFYECSGFSGSLTIPNSVRTIGAGAFRGCFGFTGTLTISDSVTTIGEQAFYYCSGFTGSLTIPDSVTTIGDWAFSSCFGFTGSLTIPDSVTTIGEHAFSYCLGFTDDLIIPDSVTSIGAHAFDGCLDIQTVYFNGNVPSTWGENALPEEVVIYYPEGNTSGWTSPTWTAPDGTVYNTMTFNSNGSSIESTWDKTDVILSDVYSFIGYVSTTAKNGLKDLQININSATDDTVGIKYYRAENIGTESFDLATVPVLTVNATLSDEDQTIVLAPGTTWEVQLWATDTDGNAIGDSEIMMLTISEEEISDSIYWDGSIAKSFAGGIGTENDPYRIETAAQLVYFLKQIADGVTFENEYIILVNDIVLNQGDLSYDLDSSMIRYEKNSQIRYKKFGSSQWYYYDNSINEYVCDDNYVSGLRDVEFDGDYYYSTPQFNGCFDGLSNCIYGMLFDEGFGLFGKSYGIITNLNIANSVFSLSKSGSLVTDNQGLIDNCHVDAIVYSSSDLYSGGIAGRNYEIIKNTTFNGVIIDSNKTSIDNVGGIAGQNYSKINNCINYSTIIADDKVGGIVGYAYSCSSTDSSSYVVIDGCKNYGNIQGDLNVGGICGYCEIRGYEPDAIFTVSNSHNYGLVNGSSQVGGIIGFLESVYEYSKNTIENCSNWGTIYSSNKSVGGLIGYIDISNTIRDSASYVDINRCYSIGNVSGNSNVGGLIGYASSQFWCYLFIEDCYNNATVVGSSNVAGLLGTGSAINGVRMNNIYNNGDLSCLDDYCGPIFGNVQIIDIYTSSTISNIYYENTTFSNNIDEDASVENIVSLSDEKMKSADSFIGFDFDTIWEISVTEGYPYPTLRDNPHNGSVNIPEEPSEITSTWDTSPITLNVGETYDFSGKIKSVEPLDKLHISIVKADNTSVGIDYYREIEIGDTSFDLSVVPSITAGTLLKGLQITNNQSELSLGNGSYIIRMWITDVIGNSSGEITKLISITNASDAPVVEMLSITEITASTAKLQAKVVDSRGGIIVDYGFNMYDVESGGERYAQYSASHPDPYYRTAQYDPTTGIITVNLKDYNPNRTYYAEGFAVYYQGETPIAGFTPERTGFTTSVAQINITSPKAYEVLSSANFAVSGNIDCKIDGVTFENLILTVYDYQMSEVFSINGALNSDNTFTVEIDMTDKYAGTYYITASVDTSIDTKITSLPISFNIPGKLAVYTDPVNERKVFATMATVTGRVPDTMGETLEYYGFRTYDENGKYLGMYFMGHDDESRHTTSFDPTTGVITGDIYATPGSTIYYEAFASYMIGDVQVDSISNTLESFTTKNVDITLDKINSYDDQSYMLDTTAAAIKFHGHISNIAEGRTFENPRLIVTDVNGNVVDTSVAILEGNNFTAEFNMSAYEVGEYTITAQITDDLANVSYSNEKKVKMPKKCSDIVFKTNLGGEILNQDEVHTVGHNYWMVVDIDIDVDRSDIQKIEWETSDPFGLSLVPWNKSEKSFDKARPQTCQFNAKEKGYYTVTVKVTNYDGSVVTADLEVCVKSVTTLTFVDYSTLKPIEDVYVRIDSDYEYNTNELGQVILYEVPEQQLYSLLAMKTLGATTYNTIKEDLISLNIGENNTIMMFNSDIDVYSVKMTATKKANGKTIITHENVNIISSATTLNMSDDTVRFDLIITDNYNNNVIEYQLIQEGKVKASSKTKEFKQLTPNSFKQNSEITLRLICVNGEKINVKLQLKFVKSGLDVSDDSNYGSFTLGNGISITVPDVIPVVGGMNLKMEVGKLPFSMCVTPQKLMIGLGLNKDIFGKAYKIEDKINKGFSEMEKNFDGVAALIDELTDLALEKNFKGIGDHLDLQKYLANKEDPPKPILEDLKPDVKLVGTISFNFASQKLSYSLIFTCKSDFEKDFNVPPIGPVPVVVTINGEISFKAVENHGIDFNNIVDDVGNIISDFEFNKLLDMIFDHIFAELEVSLGVKFGLGAGVGVHKVASLTINGDVGLVGKHNFSTQYSTVTLTLDFSVRARLLAFEYRKDFFKKEWLLGEHGWREEGKDAAVYSLRNIASTTTSEYTLADRSYLNYTSDWYEYNDISTFASFGDRDYTTDVDTLMTYIYPDTQVQTVQTDKHKVMIWLTDDATRSSANRTKLVYSVYDEITGKWSTPQSVSDDGTLDSYPYMVTDGENIWATWVNMKTALTDDMTLDTGMLHSEICVGMFDPQTMSFRKVTNLTSNDVIDLNPSISVNGDQVIASWISNDNGDLWGTSGSNTIYISRYVDGRWTDAEAVCTLSRAVTFSKVGFVSGKPCVSYAVDADNSLDTSDDISIYLLNLETGVSSILTESGRNCNIQFVTIDGEQCLTWYSDGYIRYINNVAAESKDLLNGVQVTGNYQIVSDINGLVIIKTLPMDGFSELYVSVYDKTDNSWSNDIRLTYQNNAYINDFGALVEDNGDITVVYTSEIEDMAQMCTGSISFVKDISLDSVSHNFTNAIPGQMTELYTGITNHGLNSVENLNVQLIKDGVVLSETAVETDIRAGETADLIIPVLVPDVEGVSEFEVNVYIPETEEINMDNNIGTVEFGYANISLYVSDMYGDSCRLLTFEVINNGGYDTGAIIEIRKDDEDQTLIDTIQIDTLKGKTTELINYILSEEIGSVYINIIADRDEIYIGDNSIYYYIDLDQDYIVSGEITSYGIDTDPIIIRLLDSTGTVVDSTETTTGEYVLSALAGDYILEISKKNHVTREYNVTIVDTDITLDVKIHLLGDITGDGNVDIDDVDKANLHYKNKAILSGYELLCADVTGDGNVNILDVNKMNLHYKNKMKLW